MRPQRFRLTIDISPRGECALQWLKQAISPVLEIGAAPMEALRERQKALRAALAENRRSTRTLEQAEERRQARAWRLTPWLRNVVLILYI